MGIVSEFSSGFSFWVCLVQSVNLSSELSTKKLKEERNCFHIMLHIEFFSKNHNHSVGRSVSGMMEVKAAVIGRLPVAYALCGSSLIKVVASLHGRFSVVIIALSRTVAV